MAGEKYKGLYPIRIVVLKDGELDVDFCGGAEISTAMDKMKQLAETTEQKVRGTFNDQKIEVKVARCRD